MTGRRTLPASSQASSRDATGADGIPDGTRAAPDILVVLLCPLGDTLFATPALRALRRHFPRAHITALCWTANEPLLRHNPHLDEVVACPGAWDLALSTVRMLDRRFDIGVGLSHFGSWVTPFFRARVRVGFHGLGRFRRPGRLPPARGAARSADRRTGLRASLGRLPVAGGRRWRLVGPPAGPGPVAAVQGWWARHGRGATEGCGGAEFGGTPVGRSVHLRRRFGRADDGGTERAWRWPWRRLAALGGTAPDRELHAIEYCLQVVARLGCAPCGLEMELVTGPDERGRAAALLAGLPGDGPVVALHPGADHFPAKRWPVDRFALLADRLAERYGARVVLVGGPGDVPLAAAIRERVQRAPLLDLTGRLALLETAAVLERVDLMVGNDSGPLHMAVAVGTPVVALFGPSEPRHFAPLDPRHRVLVGPCLRGRRCVRWLNGPLAYLQAAECRCEAMATIGVEAVVAAAGELLGAGRRPGAPGPAAAEATGGSAGDGGAGG